MSNILVISQLSKDLENNNILYNLDLNIQQGSITALLGFNGNGKEKLLEILAGLDTASSGSISLEDKPFSPKNVAAALKSGVIMITENASLATDLTVRENLTLGLPKTPKKTAITTVLEKVGLKKLTLNTLCNSLTASESHMLLLARAILSGSKLYLFNKVDSPFSKEERSIYFNVIRELKSNGATVIFIPAIIEKQQFIDKYIAIVDGHLLESADNTDNLIKAIYTNDKGSVFPNYDSSRNNKIIMESLALKATILQDASINIREKEVCGIYGLKGSGIEELISILTGSLSTSSGVLSANSTNLRVKNMSPVKRNKAGISVFNGKANYDLDYDSRNLKLRALSGNILLLIDPAYGLPAKDRKNFYNLINEIKMQNKAIILYTSSIEELQGLCDTIAIIHNGELSATRANNNWTDEEIYKYVTSGKLEAFSIL